MGDKDHLLDSIVLAQSCVSQRAGRICLFVGSTIFQYLFVTNGPNAKKAWSPCSVSASFILESADCGPPQTIDNSPIFEEYALDNLQVLSEAQPETKCMYCWTLKPASDITLEHAIPQSLGGAQSPQRYKVRAACRRCNSSLGLHVDASFEKSWLPSIALGEAARHLAETNDKVVPPLVCTGLIHLDIPGLLETEVCEWWTGSQAEHVILIRPIDEERYWYMGGNPIALKQTSANARAYYFFNENADPNRSLLEFKESFKL